MSSRYVVGTATTNITYRQSSR